MDETTVDVAMAMPVETAMSDPLAAAAIDPPAAAPPPDELVERWWYDHFPGSAVARDTEAWNVAFAAKEELKRRLGLNAHSTGSN